jgi:tetratricopeptide (TPR) repeat protein
VQKNLGNYREAISLFDSSLYYRKQIGDKELVGRVYNNVAGAFSGLNEFDSAMYYYLVALRIAEELNNLERICDYSNNWQSSV